MEDENGTETAGLPLRQVTVNQIVGWNIGHLRRAAGMTQRELGGLLGWTNVAVSEAERSFDGSRTRLFDAQELTQIALALEVPLTALLLPPGDDGIEAHYIIAAPGAGIAGMREYMEMCVLPDSDEDSPVMDSYRGRLVAVLERHFAPEYAARASAWLRDVRSPAERADFAGRMRDGELALAEIGKTLRDIRLAIMEGLQ